jgi:hypothetical protein
MADTLSAETMARVRATIAELATVSGRLREWLGAVLLPFLKSAVGDASDLDRTFRGTLLRFGGWLSTISKSNTEDIQATAAGARASFEFLADVAVLVSGPGRMTEMIAWEDSAKLKNAEARLRPFTNSGKPIPADMKIHAEYVEREGARIRAARVKHWPASKDPSKGQHPDRWYDRTLPDVLKDCGGVIDARLIDLFHRFSGPMNWGVHGSALVFARGISTSAIAQATSLYMVIVPHCALEAVELVLGHYKLTKSLSSLSETRGRTLLDSVLAQERILRFIEADS